MGRWALIIAIEDYPNLGGGWDKHLPGTNQAAEDFRAWVMATKKVPEPNIIGCADATRSWRTMGTTRQDIANAFTELVQRARNDGGADELYVFFSGHGVGFVEDPNLPTVDVLIASDFHDASTGGPACIQFTNVKEKLRVALGQGKHFYFIDACRNALNKEDIEPIPLGHVWGNWKKGNATTFVLFSTAPGDIANVNSGFNSALLDGLKGKGRAKVYIEGKMYVTFDRLHKYVKQVMKKKDLGFEQKGPADDYIVELDPTPVSNCVVQVIGATPTDQFILKTTDLRMAPLAPVTFVGPQKDITLFPDSYLFQLTTSAGIGVSQIAPPPDPRGVDLYEDGAVKFQMGLAQKEVAAAPLPPGSEANVRIFGSQGADLVLREIASGAKQTLTFMGAEITTNLHPGQYQFQLRDGDLKLQSVHLDISPGARLDVDLTPTPAAGAQASIAKRMPNNGAWIQFSETLGNIADWNLSLWLALLGSSRILAARDKFSKLRSLELETFTDATPGKSVLYVLAGELGGAVTPICDTGREPRPRPMGAVPGVPGLFQTKLEFDPGPLLVTYESFGHDPLDARRRAVTRATTILVRGLPNRATLLTFAQDDVAGQQIQQFMLPIHSLADRLSERERRHLNNREELLPNVRYMSTAQRLFARQAPIGGHTHRPNAYWFDMLFRKWLDPVMALIACYELIRRGAAENDKVTMREVLHNMRLYFPGFADTEVIAMLIGEPYDLPSTAPLLMDGVIALGAKDILPLREDRLDFNSIWTSWRNALSLRAILRTSC
jgi:hypothetical protein